LAVKINGNLGAQQEICFNKSFKRISTISCDVTDDSVGPPQAELD